MFDSAQAHLLIVHLPVVGVFFAFITLSIAFFKKEESLWSLGVLFMLLCTLGSVVAYFTGPPTVDALTLATGNPTDQVQAFIEAHAVWGRALFVGCVLLGVLALQTWLQTMQGLTPSRVLKAIVVFGCVILLAVASWTAHLGGLIRHAPELA